MTKNKPEGYVAWTVADLQGILAEYPQDAEVTITQYPSVKPFVVSALWHFPIFAKIAGKRGLDIFPSRNVEFVAGDKDRVELG